MSARIDRLLAEIGDGCAAFICGYPNIFYYSGFKSEDAWLIISRDRQLIVTDSRYYIQARSQTPDFDVVKYEDGWKNILKNVPEKTLYVEEDVMTCGFLGKLHSVAPDKLLKNGQKKINKPRRTKDMREIEKIAAAEHIGDMAFSHILEFLKVGMTEREVALEIEFFMKKQGASALSFRTIAASGVRGAMPHGEASDKIIEKGDMLTLDFGCVYNGYCSDMTRTVVFGLPDEKQRRIYNTVLKAQTAALDVIRVGIPCVDVDATARKVIDGAGFEGKFIHSLGHSVGTEIHESPVFSSKSKDLVEEGNVMSVEPGIYIDGYGGVRIEDLIAVVGGVPMNLTHSTKEFISI